MPWKVFTQSLALTNFGDKQGYVNVETDKVVKGRGLRCHHALQRLYLWYVSHLKKQRACCMPSECAWNIWAAFYIYHINIFYW